MSRGFKAAQVGKCFRFGHVAHPFGDYGNEHGDTISGDEQMVIMMIVMRMMMMMMMMMTMTMPKMVMVTVMIIMLMRRRCLRLGCWNPGSRLVQCMLRPFCGSFLSSSEGLLSVLATSTVKAIRQQSSMHSLGSSTGRIVS